MGIASLVLGILGLGLIGIPLGIAGLVAANQGRATNRGVAIAGIVVGFLVGVGILVSSSDYDESGQATSHQPGNQEVVQDLKLGDCYALPDEMVAATEPVEVFTFTLQDCAGPHYGEVYYEAWLPDGDFPGDDEVFLAADEVCFAPEALSRLTEEAYETMYIEPWSPTREGWGYGDRHVTCAVVPYPPAEVTGSRVLP